MDQYRIIDDIRSLLYDLEKTGFGIDRSDVAAIECLQLGLPLLEAKYGHSSAEAEAVRSIIADHE